MLPSYTHFHQAAASQPPSSHPRAPPPSLTSATLAMISSRSLMRSPFSLSLTQQQQQQQQQEDTVSKQSV
jgi:hypothetical protein